MLLLKNSGRARNPDSGQPPYNLGNGNGDYVSTASALGAVPAAGPSAKAAVRQIRLKAGTINHGGVKPPANP